MHCRVPITNSLFMTFYFWQISILFFEHITLWEWTTDELATFIDRTIAPNTTVRRNRLPSDFEFFKEIIYRHNYLFLGVKLKDHVEIVGF